MQTVEGIVAAVTAQLEKIQVANGYRTDVGRVYRVPVVTDQIPESDMPALAVVIPDDGIQFTVADKTLYRVDLRLVIGGAVSVGDADLLDPARATAINGLFQDTFDALLEDPTFGGACKQSVIQAGAPTVDADRGWGVFNMRFNALAYMGRRI